jgi:Flp pilus assembly pilin Flp
MDNDQLQIATEKAKSPARRFLRDERGAGLVEYILLAGLIAIACILAFRGFGNRVGGTVTKQGEKIESELTPK